MSVEVKYDRADIFISLGVAALMLALVGAAWAIRGVGGVFPHYIAAFGLIIALIDLATRAWRFFRPAARQIESKPVHLSEFAALIWPVVFVGLTYIAGFYAALPVFMALFFLFRRTVKSLAALMILLGFSVAMYIVFSVLLGVNLYPGLLNIAI